MSRKKKNDANPEIHKELKGFDIKINEFGELTSSLSVEKLNTFLNDKVDDKKLRAQDSKRSLDKEREDDDA